MSSTSTESAYIHGSLARGPDELESGTDDFVYRDDPRAVSVECRDGGEFAIADYILEAASECFRREIADQPGVNRRILINQDRARVRRFLYVLQNNTVDTSNDRRITLKMRFPSGGSPSEADAELLARYTRWQQLVSDLHRYRCVRHYVCAHIYLAALLDDPSIASLGAPRLFDAFRRAHDMRWLAAARACIRACAHLERAGTPCLPHTMDEVHIRALGLGAYLAYRRAWERVGPRGTPGSRFARAAEQYELSPEEEVAVQEGSTIAPVVCD